MKTPTTLPRPESVALEEAREALNPAEEICPPPNQMNALLMGASHCQCGCCALNKAIRRGLLRASQAPAGGWESSPNFRLGLGALAELGAALKVGLYVLGVTVVLAGPMAVMDHLSLAPEISISCRIYPVSGRASQGDGQFFRPHNPKSSRRLSIPDRPTTPAKVVTIPDRPTTPPKVTTIPDRPTNPPKVIVPEVLDSRPSPPAPPTNLRISRVQ